MERLWILDVDGGRHVLHAVPPPDGTAQDTRLVNEVVDHRLHPQLIARDSRQTVASTIEEALRNGGHW